MAEAPELPHPREVYQLLRQEAAERGFLEALERGRLHHAWLLCGPQGLGKATFAYRAARRLLGARPDPAYGLIGSAPGDVVSRQVAARTHPDLMVLERLGEDGRPRKVIPVDDVRRLPEFFAKAPAIAPWRVAIVDAVDDLNVNAANALLKVLEEPPQRGALFLVSHTPGGLLATIRSRCRRLVFHPWTDEQVAEFLAGLVSGSEEDRLRLARMAKGSPGRALDLAARDALAIDDAAHELLRRLPQTDSAALLSLTDGFRGAEGASGFAILFERLAERVRVQAVEAARSGHPDDAWGRAWETLVRLPREVEALNLDRTDAFWTAMQDLRAAASS